MGSSGLITVELKPHNMKSVLSFLCLSLIQGQATDAPKPEWDERGCPALENPLPCMAKSTSCIHEDRTNVYKTVRARSWGHCGKACLPDTKCEYWTFRHAQRKCYLLKSCCNNEAQGFQSGDQYCPGYDDWYPTNMCLYTQ